MNREQSISLAREWYGESKNKTGKPNIDHVIEVANEMEKAQAESGETLDPAVSEKLYLACLGHDLLEDTKASREDIEKNWGKDALDLIDSLTNRQGDDNPDLYIEQLSKSSEETLLIKYADILANLNLSIRDFDKNMLDSPGFYDFWIPLLEKYDKRLLDVKFRKYLKLQNYFQEKIRNGIKELLFKHSLRNQ